MPTANSCNTIQPHKTPLDAIKNGHFQQVRFLLELDSRAKRPQITTQNKAQSLSLCAIVIDDLWALNLAHCLLQYGARTDWPVDEWRIYPLHYFVLYNRIQLTKLILESSDINTDINQADIFGNTALHISVLSADIEIVRLLVQFIDRYGGNLDVSDRFGRTPLMLAEKLGRQDIVALLKRSGADPKAADLIGNTSDDYKDDRICKLLQKSVNYNRRDTITPEAFNTKSACDRAGKPKKANLGNTLRLLHNPSSTLLKTYPIPSDLFERIWDNSSMAKKLKSTFIKVAHFADRRNYPLIVFNKTPLEVFTNNRKTHKYKRRHDWQHKINELMKMKTQQLTDSYFPSVEMINYQNLESNLVSTITLSTSKRRQSNEDRSKSTSGRSRSQK